MSLLVSYFRSFKLLATRCDTNFCGILILHKGVIVDEK